MSNVLFKGVSVKIKGNFPEKGQQLVDSELTTRNLESVRLSEYIGSNLVLNIFPSLDTSVCAMSVKRFNKIAAEFLDTKVLSISRDLPFAHDRFCVTEGIENVITLSAFKACDFGEKYGIEIVDGPLKGLLARAVIVTDSKGKIFYAELVRDIAIEPDYEKAIEILKAL